MRAANAYADLLRFGRRVITTDDAAVRLRMSASAASRLLSRLTEAGLVVPLRRGLWCLGGAPEPLELPELLTAPHPAYVSFQSALYYHGVISQIPQVIYVASLARTQRVTTRVATYSVHHLPPELFGGYTNKGGVQMATCEKALVDLLYLSNAKSRLFARLPEVEIPTQFRTQEAERWIRAIPSTFKQTMVRNRLGCLIPDGVELRRSRRVDGGRDQPRRAARALAKR